MKQIEISTIQELTNYLSLYKDDVLFRGQTHDYQKGDTTGIHTSFDRKGCIPPVMIKWSHYARFVLAQLSGVSVPEEQSLQFTQAILQHYGWRSFFVDASENPAVACWFAGNGYKDDIKVNMVEDCWEDPILLRWRYARYNKTDGNGVLYVISKDSLQQNKIGITALSSIEISGCRPRFHAQEAALIGTLQNTDLPQDCIITKVIAPASLFREYANINGFCETKTLFPGIEEDPILEAFLNMPWLRLKISGDDDVKGSIPAYTRSLDIPEYEPSIRKHMPSNIAFYTDQAIAENIADDIKFIQMPDDIIFGSPLELLPVFPKISALLSKFPHLAFETPQISWLPESMSRGDYCKGLIVQRLEDGSIALSDLIVQHNGQQLSCVGANMSWYYKIQSDGIWKRHESPDDCTCGSDWRHKKHLSSLYIIEQNL